MEAKKKANTLRKSLSSQRFPKRIFFLKEENKTKEIENLDEQEKQPDPLKFLEEEKKKQTPGVDPLKFCDTVIDEDEEKKPEEKEENQPKLLGSLGRQAEIFSKLIEEINDIDVVVPLPKEKLDENRNKKLMRRMKTSKDFLRQKSSDFIFLKNPFTKKEENLKESEGTNENDSIIALSKIKEKGFVLNDSDVQQVKESKVPIKQQKKDVDIKMFMKKEKKPQESKE